MPGETEVEAEPDRGPSPSSARPAMLWRLRAAAVTTSIGHGCTFVVLAVYLVQTVGGGGTA